MAMKKQALVAVILAAVLLLLPVIQVYADSEHEELYKNAVGLKQALKNYLRASGFSGKHRERLELQSKLENYSETSVTTVAVRQKAKKFVVSGDLIELSDSAVTVKVKRASKNAKRLVGQTVSFLLFEKSRIAGKKALEKLGLGILPGTKVVVSGFEKDGAYYAIRVVIKLPKRVVLNGRITERTENGFVMEVFTANVSRVNTPAIAEVIIYEKTKITYPSSVVPELKPGFIVNVIGYRKDGKVYALRVIVKAAFENSEEETTSAPGTTTENASTTNTSISVSQPETTQSTASGSETAAVEDNVVFRVLNQIRSLFRSLLSFLGLGK
jgi:hypothetical protein